MLPYVFQEVVCLFCYDDSTSVVWSEGGKRRGGRQHKGSLFWDGTNLRFPFGYSISCKVQNRVTVV